MTQSPTVSAAIRTRTPAVDAVCAAAVDLALAAAEDVAGIGQVGPHLGVEADDERVVTHYFACRERAYRGWRWAVTVARASRSKLVTVDETVLLPGGEAILPPEWLPWSERLRPGDLGVGDLLPTHEDDERLVPGYTGADEDFDADWDADGPGYGYVERPDDDGAGDGRGGGSSPGENDRAVAYVAYELGLGRARVLSLEGRAAAAQRWYEGDHGPHSPIAAAAPAQCSTCGFLVQLAGPLRQVFGVCANEYSPSDGQTVSYDHGCGAHSEVAVLPAIPEIAAPIMDEFSYEPMALHPEHSAGSVESAGPAEDLGHS